MQLKRDGPTWKVLWGGDQSFLVQRYLYGTVGDICRSHNIYLAYYTLYEMLEDGGGGLDSSRGQTRDYLNR